MKETFDPKRRNAISKVGGALGAAAGLFVAGGVGKLAAQSAGKDAIGSAAILALTKRELGLPYDIEAIPEDKRDDKQRRDFDFSDAEQLTHWARRLAKNLTASGEYSEEGLVKIKLAMLDAEKSFHATGLSKTDGRTAMTSYFDTLAAI